MESIDNLVVAFLDLELRKKEFKTELAKLTNLIPSDIIDVYLVSSFDGVIHQKLVIDINEKLTFEDLKRIPFDYIDEFGNIVIEIGDVIV